MDIYARPGTKVVPIFKDGKLQHGYENQRQAAEKILEEGKVYTVVETIVSQSYSTVYLEELPGKAFNTVHFYDLDKLHMFRLGVEEGLRQAGYPIVDDTWPSRRWNEDMTDYIDLSRIDMPDIDYPL